MSRHLMADKEDISKILHQLTSFQLQFDKINERIDNLEKQDSSTTNTNKIHATEPNADFANDTDHTRSNSEPTTTSPGLTTSSTAADTQKDFERIKEIFQRTPVPDKYKVQDNAVGIKQECRQSLKILSKCARLAPGQSLFDNPEQGQHSGHNQLYPEIRCDCSPLSSGEICPKTSLFDYVIPSISRSVDETMTYLTNSVFPKQGNSKKMETTLSEESRRNRRQAEDTRNPNFLENRGIKEFVESPATHRNRHEFGNSRGTHRVTSSQSTYFFQPDHLISSQIFIPTWDPNANVSDQDASDACAKALFRAPVTLTCVEFDFIGQLISVAFDFCKQDIQIKGDVSWSPYNIRIIQSACEFSAIENAANFSLIGAAIPLWPHDLGTALTCPLGCGEGTCVDTGCMCQEGFEGFSCETKVSKRDDTKTTKSSQHSNQTSSIEPPMTSELPPEVTSSTHSATAYTILPVVVDIDTPVEAYPSWQSVLNKSKGDATTVTEELTTPTTPTTQTTLTTFTNATTTTATSAATATTTTTTTTTLPMTREFKSTTDVVSPKTATTATTTSSTMVPTALPFIPYTPSTRRSRHISNAAVLTTRRSTLSKNTTSNSTPLSIPHKDIYSVNLNNTSSQLPVSVETKDVTEKLSSSSSGRSTSVTETTSKETNNLTTAVPSSSRPLKNLEPVEVYQGVEYEACDVTIDRCTLVAFQSLFKERSLHCRISPVQITPHSYILLSEPIITSSVRSQLGQFTCVLPYISYLYQIFQKVTKFQSLRLEAVDRLTSSVIGVKFLTIFDSTCQICRRQGRHGCAVKAGTCYIQNKCYQADVAKPYDPCKQCVPSLNRREWSVTQDNKAPVINAQNSVVVFSGQDARMKIEASDPEGSKIILAVDRKDAFISQNGDFLWRAIGKDRGQDLREEKFTLTAKDVCNATTALRLVIRSVPCGCLHGGTCLGARFLAVENGHTVEYDCQCRPGYTGSRCEKETNECDPNPCKHGTCVDLLNGFRCLCQYGYQGRLCNRSRDPCQEDPCFPSVTCFNQGDTFTCGSCPDGFEGDGKVCIASTPCAEKPCFSGVACSMDTNSPQGYKCGPCPRYFTGDGKICRRTAKLACQDRVCADVSNCLESNEAPGYKCGPCPSDYYGDGFSCTPECNISCPHRQTCVRPNICGCIKGYTGLRCNQPVCDPPCQHEGICQKPNECRCYAGYAGSHCQLSRCTKPCKNGGRCIGKNRCLCPYGYSGSQCQILACRHACLNGGHCVGPNTCACPSGYTGKNCESPICEPRCLNGGVCLKPGQCQCHSGYQGEQCERALCYPSCKNGGECRRFNTCKCPNGYSGRRCQYPICRPHCMNGGRCIGPDKCLCTYGWTGHRCDQPLCHLRCQNGGVCINPDMCACPRGFTGADCSRRDNRYASRYWRPRYYYNRYGS